ncbi:MAG: ATP synthase F1 subunit delta [Rhodospirillales bacterium 20-60-12]|nr:MAG: ATP synthase F1 subunit delta [Rhodospirillales bacterium 20-60-12]
MACYNGSETKVPRVASSIDLGSSGFAVRYAKALYELAAEQSALDQTVEQMRDIGRMLDESEDFRRFVASRLTGGTDAARALDAVLVNQGCSKLIRDFAGVVVANRRLHDLPELVTQFAAYVAARRGIVVAEVTSAHPLSGLQRTQLLARLTEAGYGQVDIHEQVDASLLGGLTLKIGARLYDTSLKSSLQRLQYALHQPSTAQSTPPRQSDLAATDSTKGVA